MAAGLRAALGFLRTQLADCASWRTAFDFLSITNLTICVKSAIYVIIKGKKIILRIFYF